MSLKKGFLCMIFLFSFSQLVMAQEKKYHSIVGAGVMMSYGFNNSNSLIVPMGAGATYTVLPREQGFFGVTSIAFPFYLNINRTPLQSMGIISNNIYGYAKTFNIDFSFNNSTGYITLGAGLHFDFMTFADSSGSIQLINLGPGLVLSTGNSTSRMHSIIGLYYDFFNYIIGQSASESISGDLVGNVGMIIGLGYRF